MSVLWIAFLAPCAALAGVAAAICLHKWAPVTANWVALIGLRVFWAGMEKAWEIRHWITVFRIAYYKERLRRVNQRLLERQGLSDGLRIVNIERRKSCDCGHQCRLHENEGCIVETCGCKKTRWHFLKIGGG